jgi:hypothetical protein
MVSDPNPELTQAFKQFTDDIVAKVQAVNAACLMMKQQFPGGDINVVPHDTHPGENGAAIRDYENAMEELKRFIENRNCDNEHNVNLKRLVGTPGNQHAIRAVEVELVHPDLDGTGSTIELAELVPGEERQIIAAYAPEYQIIAVRVRGLISGYPASGNEEPTYSSKSSSSRVP